jgi:bifunctional DNA-binding transcriptional regulator/antitoxin component of YhaV-PrlF toxin-antitoxin module
MGSSKASARVSSKFQISIPKAVREEAGVLGGQDYVFVPKGKNLLLVRVPAREEIFGLYKGADNFDVRDHTDRH